MRFETIAQSLATARSNLTKSLDGYAERRATHSGPSAILPGQFLDEAGAKGSQYGLTAVALWIAIRDAIPEKSKAERLLKGCRRVFEETIAPQDAGHAHVVKFRTHYERLLVKRCLCILALESREQLEEELRFLLSRTTRLSGEQIEWTPFLDGPATAGDANGVITVYTLMAIADSMQRLGLTASRLATDVRDQLRAVVDSHRSTTNSVAGPFAADQNPLQHLFYLNCLYRMCLRGFDSEPLTSIRRKLRHVLSGIYRHSGVDAAYVGTEIMAAYDDPDTGKSNSFLRFNTDAILLESHFFAYGQTLAAFQNLRGERLFQRVMKNYAGEEFTRDSNGERITIYSAYHVFRVLRILEDAAKERPSLLRATASLVGAEMDCEKASLVRLSLSTLALAAIGAMSFWVPYDYHQFFGVGFLLAALIPLIEYVSVKLTAARSLGRISS